MLIARVQGRNPLRYQLPIGEKLPLTLGAGKAPAAWLSEPELRTFIDRSTPFTRVSGEQVTAEAPADDLRRVRGDGYALSLSERVLNVVAISAPIRRGEETLGVSGSHNELTEDDRPRVISEVRRAADAIAARCP
ncbi:IclR family transcriptional regulator domain-containing protein [Streptomyces hebeiensis]